MCGSVKRPKKGFFHKESGQAMVEFALTLPILIMVICLIIDTGWMYYHKLAINNACREGARYASIHYSEPNYKNNVVSIVNGSLSISTPLTVTTTEPGGDSVKVRVVTEVPILTGLSSTFLGSELEIEASSTMRKEP